MLESLMHDVLVITSMFFLGTSGFGKIGPSGSTYFKLSFKDFYSVLPTPCMNARIRLKLKAETVNYRNEVLPSDSGVVGSLDWINFDLPLLTLSFHHLFS